ncbi:MAG: OmpH family outer membrane protein [Microscillaceae bacterium]|nr:OmpH family outer membrane protein [Microscillaceae bacterium]
MKNTSLIIQTILAIAVVGLYILHFTQRSAPASVNTAAGKTSTAASAKSSEKGLPPLRIAFVNVDSLDAQYEFSINARKNMQGKERQIQTDLETRARSLETEMINFQKNLPNLSLDQAKAKEKELMQKQQAFEQFRQSVGAGFMKEEQELQKKLLENIAGFMKKFGEEKGYDYILTFSGVASATLFANPGLDVTKEVIEGLNQNYRNDKK